MKLLVVTHSYGLNGSAWILQCAMRHWAQLGWQVDAVLNESSQAAHGEQLRSMGINTLEQADIPSDYDLALVNSIKEIPVVAQLAGKLPVALWIHEGTTVVHNWKRTPLDLIQLLSKPQLLIFDTPWQPEVVFRSFLHQLPRERVVCVPCGVAAPPVIARRTPGGPTRIVNVGSVYGRKRQLDLAQAVVNLAGRFPVACSFVGDLGHASTFGPRFEPFRQHPSGVLDWLGGVSDERKFAVLADAHIACFPSGDETFGLSAMESALAGLPVVLADLDVYRGLGWADGVNCLTFPVGDVGRLEDRLAALIEDPALGQRIADGGALLARGYSMDKFLDRITSAVASVT